MNRTEQLNYLTSVGSGQVAKLNCPLDRRYHAIDFNITHEVASVVTQMSRADMIANIDWVRVIVNGVRIWDITPGSLLGVYDRKKYADFIDGHLPIYFAQSHRETLASQEWTSLGTLGINPIKGVKIEIKLKSSVVKPNIRAVADYDDYNTKPDNVVKYSEEQLQISSTGKFNHTLISPIDSYASFFFFESNAGDIENVELKHGNKVVHDMTREDLSAYNLRRGYSEAADTVCLHLDGKDPTRPMPTGMLDHLGNLIPALKMLQLDMGGANAVTLVEEKIGAINIAV